MDPSRWQNVLVVQTSFLGDTVLTLPLLSEIKRRYPESKLTVLCGPQARDLLLGHADIDDIIVDDKKKTDKGLAGLWRKAAILKDRGFSMALSPHKSLRSALLLYLARIPYRVGFRQSKGWFLYHATVNRHARRHDVERNLSILEAFGIRSEECERAVRLGINPRAEESVGALFRSLSVDGGKTIFGLNPGSVWPTKRWSAEGYAEILRLLKRKHACEILLFGGAEDAQIVSEIQKLSGNGGVNLVGKIELRDLPAALSRCDLLITNDSGPMHIAVARGVPVVAVFCATTPSLGFYPYAANAVIVEKELSCRPCASHGGRRCPLGTEACIRLIRPEDVLRAAERLLADKGRGRRAGEPSYEPQVLTV